MEPVPPSATVKVPVIELAPKSTASLLLSITKPPFVFVSILKTELEEDKPSPENNVAKESIVVNCSVEPSESRVNNLSPFAGVTSL